MFACLKTRKKLCGRPAFLKVGKISPLASILLGRGEQKKGGDRGENNTKGAKTLTHYR